jgi:hypothetical protein
MRFFLLKSPPSSPSSLGSRKSSVCSINSLTSSSSSSSHSCSPGHLKFRLAAQVLFSTKNLSLYYLNLSF